MSSRFVWVAACVLIPVVLHAQRLEPAPMSFRASRSLETSNAPELVPRGNHGPEGALIGAVAVGALGYWLVSMGCHSGAVPVAPGSTYVGCTSGTKVAFTGAMALVGAGLGYFIGSSYPKYAEP